MTEYEMKIKDAANDVKYLRTSSGAMYSQMIFSLIAIMLSKKKLSKDDLDTILEVERNSVKESVKSYTETSYGQENSAISTTEDVKAVENFCLEYVDEVRKMIIEVSEQISPPKARKKKVKKSKIVPLAKVELLVESEDIKKEKVVISKKKTSGKRIRRDHEE